MRRIAPTTVPLALLALAACVPAPRPAPPPPREPVAPPPAPPPPAPPPLASDWRDWPITPGVWSYGGGVARFGQGVVTLACDRAARRVTLTRADAPGALIVRTTSTTRTLSAQGGRATLAADDRLLDAMAFSRGRFTVESPGARPLAIPAWAEVARVIEDCRG